MKFYCDKCQTKYSIADEKVRGKVLKVRCKKCSHVISVSEPSIPANRKTVSPSPSTAGQKRQPQSPSSSKPRRATAGASSRRNQVPWHYSVNGQSFGPLERDELAEKLASGELGDGIYVWNETFSEWKVVKEVSEFSAALAKATKRRPSPKTLRSSEPIKKQDLQRFAKDKGTSTAKKEVSATASDTSVALKKSADTADGAESKQPSKKHSSGTDTPPKSSRKQRLERLRSRLDLGALEDEKSENDKELKVGESTLADPEETPSSSEEEEPAPINESTPAAEDKADLVEMDDEEDLPFSIVKLTDSRDKGDSHEDASTSETGDSESSADSGLALEQESAIAHADTLLDDSAQQSAESSGVAGSHDGLFSALDSEATPSAEQVEPEEPSEDAVPFFPSAPQLGKDDDASDDSASLSRVDEMTGSLLIQINEIKSDGRKRAILASLGALAALVTIGLVVVVGWSQLGTEEEVETEDRIRMDHVGGQPQFHEYSEEELARVSDRLVLQEALVISREDGRAAYERDERQRRADSEGSGESAGEARPSEPAMPSIDPDAFRRESPPEELEEGRAGDDEDARPEGPRFARSDRPGAGASADELAGEERAADEEGDSETDSRFDAMAAVQSDTQRQIHGGDDELLNQPELQEGLSGSDIAAGVRSVMESIGSCRERHIYRGGTIDEEQIEVSLTVMPNGRVGQFKMDPDTLDDTSFGRCMHSHTGRWGFPRFTGDPVEVQAPFSLQ